MKKTFFLFFFLLISFWLAGFQSLIIKKVQAQSMSVWTTDGGRRVKKSGRDQALEKISLTPYWGDSSRIEIEAARNEYEPAQIVVTAQGSSLSNVNVSVSDLLGPGGARISSSNIKLYREHYVNVTGSSPDWGGTNQPLSPNWYPDALIPFKNPFDGSDPSGVTYDAVPFNVSQGENQPIWVDFYIPSQTPAGVYTGTAAVTASGQSSVNIPISLTVWDFEVPKTPYLRSSFLFWAYGSQRYYEEFLRHRLMPLSTGSSPSVEYYINNFGLNSQNTGPWSGVDIGNCSQPSIPSPSTFTNLESNYPTSFRDNLYDYSFDEAHNCPPVYGQDGWICQWGRNMHQGSQIKNLVVIPIDSRLENDGSGRSCVDIWTMLPFQFNQGDVDHVLQKGDTVWSYNTLVQDGYSPKWLLDFRLIEHRIFPWINESYQATGMLYWKVDGGGTAVWTDPMASFGGYNGEAYLFYPGSTTLTGFEGPVSTMRLKSFREGIEEYDYIQILKNLGGESFAKSQVDQVASSWSNWTRNPDELYQARERMAQKIIELGGGVIPTATPPGSPTPTPTTGFSPTPTSTPPPKYPDLDGDGRVNAQDMKQLLAAWGVTSSAREDLDSNGRVNALDAGRIVANWTGD